MNEEASVLRTTLLACNDMTYPHRTIVLDDGGRDEIRREARHTVDEQHLEAGAAELIDLHPEQAARPEFVDYLTGARKMPGSEPLAMLYAGHQFGRFVPQLGDGRAILLGEVRNSRGEKWDLQLKGSGLTPFSRDGDGRAVLRSTVREYLCGEAMHGLGIPTTRALCLFDSDEEVYRERIEPGAMVLRLAPSHIRFGHFDIIKPGRWVHDDFTRFGPFAHDLFVHLAFGRDVDHHVVQNLRLTSQASPLDQPALGFIAVLDRVPVRQRALFHGHPVFGKFAIAGRDLAFGADAAPATDAVEIDAKLPRGGQNRRAHREPATLARRGKDDKRVHRVLL